MRTGETRGGSRPPPGGGRRAGRRPSRRLDGGQRVGPGGGGSGRQACRAAVFPAKADGRADVMQPSKRIDGGLVWDAGTGGRCHVRHGLCAAFQGADDGRTDTPEPRAARHLGSAKRRAGPLLRCAQSEPSSRPHP